MDANDRHRRAGEAPSEKVFVAVPQEYKAGKAVLAWALGHLARTAAATVVLCHVHVPPQMIPLLGTKFHASKLRPEEVKVYRQAKMQEVHVQLDAYLHQCSKNKVKAEKLVVQNDDVVQGLIEIVAQHGITNLVMGAAADKHYPKKMISPRSKTATGVMEKADPLCRIWFIYKGNLICTREADLVTSWRVRSPHSISNSISEISDHLRSQSMPPDHLRSQSMPPKRVVSPNLRHGAREIHFMQRSESDRTGTEVGATRTISRSMLSSEDSSFDSWEVYSRSSFPSSCQASSTVTDEVLSNSGFSPFCRGNDNEVVSEVLPSILESDDDVLHYLEQEEMGLDIDIFVKLQEAYVELDNLRKKAYDESSRRHKAEEELIKCRQKMYFNEVHRRKEMEEMFGRAQQERDQLKQESELGRRQQDSSLLIADEQTQQLEVIEQLKRQNSELEQRIANADSAVKGLQGKLAAARYQLDVQQASFKELKQERDNAIRKLQELSGLTGDMARGAHGATYSEFTLLELEQATDSFSDSQKIGEGGFGRVYKGFLRSTTVAVKILHHENLQGQSQLQQEVVVLSRVRHPNLVTLIGACSEASALVYEFCDNGSLEDRLMCKDNSPPLSWQVRVRIISEIFSALTFLHSAKPHAIVHGDLKPDNILLDANLVSKLSDFGISRILTSNTSATTFWYTTNPRGTFLYMDPEFLTTGELTPRSDVYSFGIIILRLLTGRPPLAIARDVENALESNDLRSVFDTSAGDWPLDQARQLAVLGLRCAELNRKNRPNFMDEAWRGGVWGVIGL